MKNYLLTIYTVLALTQSIFSQTEKRPRIRTDLISNDTTIVKISSDVDSSKFPDKNYKFNIKFKLHINGQDSTGLITITKNGKPFKTIQSSGIKYPLALDLNSYYLFKCTKPGYITKIVFFDTKVPGRNEKDDFAKFTCFVELFKEDGKTKPADKPIGGVKYSNELKDFDYDKLISETKKTKKESLIIDLKDSSFVNAVPSEYTPNGDGINDFFVFTSRNMVKFEGQIIDRTGNIIYVCNLPGGKWDGKNKNGDEVKEGIYYYIIDAEGKDGKTYRNKGAIKLTR